MTVFRITCCWLQNGCTESRAATQGRTINNNCEHKYFTLNTLDERIATSKYVPQTHSGPLPEVMVRAVIGYTSLLTFVCIHGMFNIGRLILLPLTVLWLVVLFFFKSCENYL